MIGKSISHYQILEKLGGGMGVGFKANNTRLIRLIAPQGFSLEDWLIFVKK
jgi:hypothetical protein